MEVRDYLNKLKIKAELSKIDWNGLEKHCACTPLPDCVPSNAREWNQFRIQYEYIMSSGPAGIGSIDKPFKKIVQKTQLATANRYKNSPLECSKDLSFDEQKVWKTYGVDLRKFEHKYY